MSQGITITFSDKEITLLTMVLRYDTGSRWAKDEKIVDECRELNKKIHHAIELKIKSNPT